MPDLARLKPGVSDLFVLGLAGIIHLVDGAYQHRPPSHRLPDLGLEIQRQQLGARRVDETFVLAFDLDDVLMPADGPERTKAGRLGSVHGILAAQHRKQRVRLVERSAGFIVDDRLVPIRALHLRPPACRQLMRNTGFTVAPLSMSSMARLICSNG
ncbi:hypothetical protein SR870_04265 [Rhodopseudomonas palustris]|uniref:hypothetical protein n=1 Tax=Rhodopseudomonas palustris TaxID=1076 RepID=UPI002ACDD0FA|nr:hypothetical protein [Rhodopseudomonas palustris]WQH00518.1 hypothetical protein SR870_04265 [Rhodopseudomonas palustris]